ncbi:hypothetical protein CKG00_14035 (plasmid) [Morganella morganii]|uniref:Tail fiber assembly protein n=1 Tax=Morganella morganii TaxID=582 RepID=A0A433ZQC5_MORMO|nr:tail fiber assembly protein [Morganella morganii]RUT64322.1 hypothetical protein CKG00_14035 [Morganella morganii]
MKYIFDKKTNAFYPVALQQEYENAEMWPESGVGVTEDVFAYFRNPPEGKMLGSDKQGNPVWVNVPPLTHKQHVAIAETQKQALIAEANQKTQLWQTQLMLDIITAEDKASLTEWMLYVQKVRVVDTSTAPDIIWPEKPE